jgi:hypothetical protein
MFFLSGQRGFVAPPIFMMHLSQKELTFYRHFANLWLGHSGVDVVAPSLLLRDFSQIIIVLGIYMRFWTIFCCLASESLMNFR